MPGEKRKGSVIPSPVDPKKRKSMMSEWSDLPQDLIASMAKKLVSLEDFIVFGAVSKSCRSAATKSNFTGELTHQVPLVLQFVFPREEEIAYKIVMKNGELVILGRKPEENVEKQDNESDALIELYSLTKDKIYRFIWPPPELPKSKVCCSSLGWLLTVSEGLRFDQLINPFSNAKIELPYAKQPKLVYSLPTLTLHFVLSSSPSSTLDYTVMICFGTSHLFYCRPGLGQGWKILKPPRNRLINDVNYFKGRYYLIDHLGLVSAVDDEENQSIMRHVVAPEIPSELLGPMMRVKTSYLVESAGDLLVVLGLADTNKGVSIVGFRVFKVPFSKGKSWSDSEIKDLGNRTLFLSQRTSCFSIEASDSSRCKPNCIYFLDYNRNAGIYNMEDRMINHDLGNSFQNFGKSFDDKKSARLWIQPSFNDAQCPAYFQSLPSRMGTLLD